MSENFIVVSSDCHAGLPIAQYKDYTEEKYHEMLDMAVPITIEMSQKASESFLIKDINDEWRKGIEQQLTGAWDYKERVKMLDADGIAAEEAWRVEKERTAASGGRTRQTRHLVAPLSGRAARWADGRESTR